MTKKMEDREYLYENKNKEGGFHLKISADKDTIKEVESFVKGAKEIIDKSNTCIGIDAKGEACPVEPQKGANTCEFHSKYNRQSGGLDTFFEEE